MTDFPVEIEAVKIVRLEPGDKVFIKVRRGSFLDDAIANMIKEQAKRFFPDNEVIIGEDIDIEVLRPEAAA